ncbi:NFATC2-interacting protein [Portunus trituberculatus]|uniref:NFATC2-interacting protein n=1 Tax=Portunus trituberculatus TaxID=210409 RepID=A0A5B7FEU2_PORTR|nr:NFATC2-interacting protein [Portunus trituberculatus]
MSRGIMSDSSDSDPESSHRTSLPSPAPRVPPHWNNSSPDNSDDIFNVDYSSHNHQALKGAYKELVTEGERNKTRQSMLIQSVTSDSDDECRIIDYSATLKTRQKKEDIIEDPPSPTLFEIDKNNSNEESCRTTRRTRKKRRITDLEGLTKRQKTTLGSPYSNDSFLNISNDIVSDNEEEEDVNPEIRLRIKWDQESFWLPIRKMMSFPRLRDSRDFIPYSSSAEWAGKDKTSLSALLEVDVEGPAVAGSAYFDGLKKEDIEEGPAVAGSAGVTGTLQKFSHLYELLAEKYGVTTDHVVLNYNDKIINPALCPADLNLTIVDIIEGGVGSYTSHPRALQPISQDVDSISLRVQNSKKKGSVTINMNLKEKMSVLMHKYAEEKQIKLDKLQFMFDGELLSSNSTPTSLDLEGGECIDVYEVS